MGAFSTQWCDAALAEAMLANVDKFDLSGLSKAASWIEHAILWIDVDQQNDQYGDDDEEYHDDNVGDVDDLQESTYTVGPSS